ncbi:hypothetical protein [Nocardiopsis kunsanensis]|uniref:Uncharacterized protein n=1 Tax=Nocardiopsis kunsanensis TaxID=141693 RepID=A0A918X9J4_9ACTN|nr:hypothetical protein [Nocardiopsis kunsanensis]GHD19723.1 hypothetical protein GCM10007147_10890 [Nocardiopsis kunsanensis]
MSPKKHKRPKHHPPTPGHDTTTETAPTRRPGRAPVVIPDPPDRRITALWTGLALLWALGTPLALAHLLFTFMDLQDTLAHTRADPSTPLPGDHINALGTALIWLLALALAVPLLATLLAALLRRKIAFFGFAAALTATALPLFLLMPPTELWHALTTHFSGP